MDWNAPDSPLNGKWKITSTAGKSSSNTGRRSPVTTTSAPSIGDSSSQLTLCVEGSPVSHSVSPGSDEARQMTVTSGRKLCAALTFSGPLGSLVKMCTASSIWGSSKCVLIWRPLVIKSRCLGFQLVPSMRRTSGNGSGFLPTPRAIYGEHPGMTDPRHLTGAVHLWPTPSANNQSGGGTGLNGGSGARKKLEAMVGREEGLKMSGGQLNPTWVEWLQGYPLGWTEVD